jgi:hypothetical protein
MFLFVLIDADLIKAHHIVELKDDFQFTIHRIDNDQETYLLLNNFKLNDKDHKTLMHYSGANSVGNIPTGYQLDAIQIFCPSKIIRGSRRPHIEFRMLYQSATGTKASNIATSVNGVKGDNVNSHVSKFCKAITDNIPLKNAAQGNTVSVKGFNPLYLLATDKSFYNYVSPFNEDLQYIVYQYTIDIPISFYNDLTKINGGITKVTGLVNDIYIKPNHKSLLVYGIKDMKPMSISEIQKSMMRKDIKCKVHPKDEDAPKDDTKVSVKDKDEENIVNIYINDDLVKKEKFGGESSKKEPVDQSDVTKPESGSGSGIKWYVVLIIVSVVLGFIGYLISKHWDKVKDKLGLLGTAATVAQTARTSINYVSVPESVVVEPSQPPVVEQPQPSVVESNDVDLSKNFTNNGMFGSDENNFENTPKEQSSLTGLENATKNAGNTNPLTQTS